MVKLAEKERDGLEVLNSCSMVVYYCTVLQNSDLITFDQGVKNEAEAYMLKELLLLKWQEKATKLASDDASAQMEEMQANISSLEENLKAERYLCSEPRSYQWVYV